MILIVYTYEMKVLFIEHYLMYSSE